MRPQSMLPNPIAPKPMASIDAPAKAALPSETAAEIMLRRAQRIGRLAFWHLSGPTDDAGLRMNCTYSDGIEQIFGCNPALSTLDFVERFIHPEDQERTRSIFLRFRRRQLLQYAIEYRIRHLSSDWHLIHETGEWELSPEGKPVAAAGVIQDITDRSQLEARLHQSETLLASAQRMARIGTWHWVATSRNPYSFEGRYHHSQEVADIFGVTIPELDIPPQRFLERFVHPDDRQRLMDMWQLFRSPGRPNLEITYRARRADGAWRTLREFASWERGRDGGLNGVAGIVEDITDRLETQVTDRQRSAMLARAQRMAKLGTWIWRCGPDGDGPGEAIEFSPEAAEIHGVTAAELSVGGREYAARFVHPDDRDEFTATLARFVNREIETYSLQFRIRHVSGEWRTVLEVAEWDYSSDGIPTGTTGVMQDITERLAVEESARRNATQIRRAQQIARIGHWQWSKGAWDGTDVRIMDWSDSAAEIHGVDKSALQITTREYLKRFVHPDDRRHVADTYRRFSLHEIERYTIEFRIRNGADGWTHLREITEWDYDSAGRPVSATGAIQDITDQIHSKRALDRSEDLLERAQRIAKLAYWHWHGDPDLEDPGTAPHLYSSLITEIFGVDLTAMELTDEQYVERFVHPDDRRRFGQVLRDFSARRLKSFASEYRIRHADGRWRTVIDTGEWEYGPDGRPISASGAIQDITEWAETDRALQRSEQFLARAQQIAKLAYWHWALDPSLPNPYSAPYVYSPSIVEMFGVAPEDLNGSDDELIDRFVHPADRERVRETYREFDAERTQSYAIEYRARHGITGEWRTVFDTGEWDRDADGKVTGASGALQDITDRSNAETALRQSEKLLSRAQQVAKLGHWRWRPAPGSTDWHDGEISYSDTAAAIYGVRPRDLVVPDRQFVIRFVHPDDRERIQDIYDRFFIEGERRYEAEYRIRHGEKEWRWIHEIAEWDTDGATGVILDITGRVESDLALRDSEALLIRAQRTARVGHWVWRHNANDRAPGQGASHFSAVAAEIFGVDPEALRVPTDEWVRRFVHPEDAARVLNIFNRSVSGELTRYEIDYRARHSDGTWRWVHEIGQWDYDETGNAIGATGVLQDVTERVEAQSALRRNEAQLKRAQQIARLAYWHWTEGQHAGWQAATSHYSAEAAQIFGVSVEELGRLSNLEYLERFVHPDDRVALKSVFKEFVEARLASYSIEYRIRHARGDWRTISERGEWDRTADGRIAGATGTIQDITELREAERALTEGAARLKLMTDHLPISIGYMDMDERLQFVNATAERWYGKPAGELVGQTMQEFMDAETYRIMLPYVREAKAGKAVKMQMRRQYPAGPPRDIEMLYVPHVVANGKVAGFFGMSFDMTDRLAMEAQLRHAQKMEAVGQLTGGVAHDFNNLLGVIVGNLDLLATQLPQGTKAQSLLSTALDAAESGAALIRRLLAFSRRQMLLPKATNLSDLVGGMMVLVQRSLGEAVSIETRIPPGLWPALIDDGQLEAAILNLAINARDAMPTGGRLTIELNNATVEEDTTAADSEVLPGDYVRVTVRDTGTGIPPDVLPRVLEPFFTTKEVGKGTGLGLSMVYGFVKQSGGFLQIDSHVGEGTAISLYLPRAEDPLADTDQAAAAHRSLRGEGEVVLLVEDRADMRAYSAEALRTLNYEPIDAADGPTALALLDHHPEIAVLFSDIVLPGGMSGYELARAARAKRPDLKVLLTSGFSERAAGTRGTETETLLEKPFRSSELGRKLAALLGRGMH
ncbi:MAG TPA: PAS domain-containing protein [Hypericibacter adhaerens]|uniref:PAS domain-containing protein n=1 Tax=Hypericibacter adhaerens TaxID=2602016 RepID=UPI002BA70D5A|nr:PAS domain-containing protein [Hypericibacter adhaerens]HWA44956.1 PAS domain-containing protein [Hypericibacter adhaerens]